MRPLTLLLAVVAAAFMSHVFGLLVAAEEEEDMEELYHEGDDGELYLDPTDHDDHCDCKDDDEEGKVATKCELYSLNLNQTTIGECW